MRKKLIAIPFLAIATVAAQPVVIRTTTVYDGAGRVLQNEEIVIEGARISRIADAKSRATYDLGGLTVMPGWIDTHVHLGWHFNKEGRLAAGGGSGSQERPSEAALYAAGNAQATLMGGFTAVQSLGSAIDSDLRDLVNTGVLPGPLIITPLRSINE